MKRETINASVMVNGKKQFVGKRDNVPIAETLDELCNEKNIALFGGVSQIMNDWESGYRVRLQRDIRPSRTMDETTKNIVTSVKRITNVDIKKLVEQINVGIANGVDVSKQIDELKKLTSTKKS